MPLLLARVALLSSTISATFSSPKNFEAPTTQFMALGKDMPRLDFVRNMTAHAWGAYRQHAFGFDYLKPISKVGANHHHGQSLGFTVVDALDTLKIMGLETEFQQGRDYIAGMLKATVSTREILVIERARGYSSHTPSNFFKNNFDLDMEISSFETIIRMVGGLVAAYDLSQDKVKYFGGMFHYLSNQQLAFLDF